MKSLHRNASAGPPLGATSLALFDYYTIKFVKEEPMNRRLFTSSMAAGMLGAISPCGAQRSAVQRRGLRLSVTCDMFRGEEVRLPFDTPDRRDPRPKPRRKLAPQQALALAQARGYQAFELFDWRDPVEWDGYREAQQTYGLNCACIEANKGVRAPGCGLSIFQSKDEPEVGFELRKADRWCEELLSETVAMVEWGGGLGGGGS